MDIPHLTQCLCDQIESIEIYSCRHILCSRERRILLCKRCILGWARGWKFAFTYHSMLQKVIGHKNKSVIMYNHCRPSVPILDYETTSTPQPSERELANNDADFEHCTLFDSRKWNDETNILITRISRFKNRSHIRRYYWTFNNDNNDAAHDNLSKR